MTFKEALKNDLTRVTPAPELLSRISEIMREEAEKPRVSPFRTAVRFAGMAAAVTLLAFGAVRFFGSANTNIPTEYDASGSGMEETAPMNGDSAGNGILFYAEAVPETNGERNFDGMSEGAAAPPAATFPAGLYDYEDSADDEAAACDAADEMRDEKSGFGGDEFALYYGLSDQKIACIDGGLIDIVGGEAFEEWRIGKESAGCTTDLSEEVNLYALIRDFPQYKEEIRARLLEMLEIDRRHGWNITLSEEEIELLMNGEKDAVSEYFASPAAICHDGKIYSPEWLDTHEVSDYEAEKLPKEQLREKLDEILWLSNFMDLTSLIEKLSEYLGETVTVPEWTEPMRTETFAEEAIPEEVGEADFEEIEEVPEE